MTARVPWVLVVAVGLLNILVGGRVGLHIGIGIGVSGRN